MAKYTKIVIILIIADYIAADDRIHFNEEDERRWNTPPELTPEAASATNDNAPSPRFLPFSASFTLSSGTSNAHSLSVGGSNDGISLSQSQSSSSGGFTDSGISASQSSSFTAGLSGISASDANAFNLKHPVFGGHSQADSNSFALGQASASSHGGVVDNIASTGAQSSVGNSYSSAASGASSSADNHGGFHPKPLNPDRQYGKPSWTNIGPNYEIGGVYNPSTGQPVFPGVNQPQTARPLRLNIGIDDRRLFSQHPEVLISDYQPPTRHYRPFRAPQTQIRVPDNRDRWSQDHLVGPSPQTWSQNEQHPSLQVSSASASSSASSNSPNAFSFGQSSSHGQSGSRKPSSWSTNYAESSGNSQSHAQGSAAAVGQHSGGKGQASFSSGAISASSTGNGHSQGTSLAGNRGDDSRGQVNNQSFGTASAQGTANSGSVSISKFPSNENNQNIPREFVRNRPINTRRQPKINRKDPIDDFFTDLTDSVSDLFDF